ncbi:MAG: UDP binding domain-containing protein, partial [Acidobacteriota bacterium]
DVMADFCLDTKLNLSPTYLKPGSAFGGSCLPKDLRALLYHARNSDVDVPVLQAILPSNELQKDLAFQQVRATGKRRIGMLGLSFKAGTDDLRESPAVQLAEMLIGKGYELAIYDQNVSLARLVGANRAYIENEIPHLSSLMRESIAGVEDFAEVLVVTTPDPDFKKVARGDFEDRLVVDLVGLLRDDPPQHYQGICW